MKEHKSDESCASCLDNCDVMVVSSKSWTDCGARCGAEAVFLKIIALLFRCPRADFSFGCYSKFCAILEIVSI